MLLKHSYSATHYLPGTYINRAKYFIILISERTVHFNVKSDEMQKSSRDIFKLLFKVNVYDQIFTYAVIIVVLDSGLKKNKYPFG